MTTRFAIFAAALSIAALALPQLAGAQTGKSYPDGHGGEVFFPLGDISFADEVVSFTPGDPAAAPDDSNPGEALGIPDYVDTVDDNYLTLGCRGIVVLRFSDNALVDIDGPDLYVFEIGPAVEPTDLAISGDGETWIEVGRISGATAEVDIASFAAPEDTFSFVRLTDAASACSGQWPGADIDTVGAIGAGRRIVLDSAVLFDFDRFDLKAEAEQILLDLSAEITALGNARIVVEGHTDSTGSDDYNLKLSQDRAASVTQFLTSRGGVSAQSIESVGYGETRPAVANDTEENQARNRRVELLIVATGQ